MKAFFINFKGHSVAKHCLRPKSRGGGEVRDSQTTRAKKSQRLM